MIIEDSLNRILKIVNRGLWTIIVIGLLVFLYCLATQIITIEDIRQHQPTILYCLKWWMGITTTLGGVACIYILYKLIKDYKNRK